MLLTGTTVPQEVRVRLYDDLAQALEPRDDFERPDRLTSEMAPGGTGAR